MGNDRINLSNKHLWQLINFDSGEKLNVDTDIVEKIENEETNDSEVYSMLIYSCVKSLKNKNLILADYTENIEKLSSSLNGKLNLSKTVATGVIKNDKVWVSKRRLSTHIKIHKIIVQACYIANMMHDNNDLKNKEGEFFEDLFKCSWIENSYHRSEILGIINSDNNDINFTELLNDIDYLNKNIDSQFFTDYRTLMIICRQVLLMLLYNENKNMTDTIEEFSIENAKEWLIQQMVTVAVEKLNKEENLHWKLGNRTLYKNDDDKIVNNLQVDTVINRENSRKEPAIILIDSKTNKFNKKYIKYPFGDNTSQMAGYCSAQAKKEEQKDENIIGILFHTTFDTESTTKFNEVITPGFSNKIAIIVLNINEEDNIDWVFLKPKFKSFREFTDRLLG